ncbi:BCCT family transporter [Brevibacterium casei]|uniref:BCCT transporter n=3 Tax=Brevibacterium TaxID=1696 RepID=A0A269ZCT1_9MICO|nr:BCCT family transporter [Brevibacterium casei]NJE66124.1 BCCT family transporter [Brevibacterium sp. LS14]MBE4693477.1 BCCT family transporter [Brevibacterium casei]MBY3576600.1 BCCT family transporter [Brevibacterium casei]MDH5147681.1 BCCT family transporter [Brevibacterium casei]PAK95320.1 BCCT transporter [Brevibacterium casei]
MSKDPNYAPADSDDPRPRADWSVAGWSTGILAAFVVAALVAPDFVADGVAFGFAAATSWFGLYWQWLLLLTFFVALALIFTPWAKARLGGSAAPEYGRFKWIAMIMTTLLAGGGVFWAAAEPLYHYSTVPPYFAGTEQGSQEGVFAALAVSFVDWGFLAWAILGSLGAIVMMIAAEKGLPLRPRSLLYPILGRKAATSRVGAVVDVVCIVSVAAGTIGPVGFLGLQISYALESLFGIPDVYWVQVMVIAVLTAIAGVSVFSGINKGIQLLSSVNVFLALGLIAVVLALGSAWYVLRGLLGGLGLYIANFVPLSLFQGDSAWTASWTVFFFGWFLGYAPLMAIFVARISRGRTARDLLIGTSILPPIATTVWFAVLGGTGIYVDQKAPGAVTGPLADDGLPAAIIAITSELPMSVPIAIGFLVLTMTFVATTTDSMSFAISQSCMSAGDPGPRLRVIWAVLIGAAAAVLISIGDGGVGALQSAIVIAAVPVGFVMLPSLVAAPVLLRNLALEQGVVSRKRQIGLRATREEAPRVEPDAAT